MSDKPIICGHCRKPIHKDETKRHYGFYSAHLESRCRELLQMDIAALRAENARLRGALESFVSADATDAKRMRLAIVDARARLAKGRGLWNGPCHECDEVLRRALTVNNYPAALGEKGE